MKKNKTNKLLEISRLESENERLKNLVIELQKKKEMLKEKVSKKMKTPAQKRTAVELVQENIGVSQRRASKALNVNRQVVRYKSKRKQKQSIN
jgi:hypothetical protein